MNRKNNLNSKEAIKEAVDIIRNTEDDEAAMIFLRETLGDNYPELDLGRMDLHEAIEVLGGGEENPSQSKGDREKVENLSASLSTFMNSTSKKASTPKKKGRRRRRRKRK